jgi:hypothetical protein
MGTRAHLPCTCADIFGKNNLRRRRNQSQKMARTSSRSQSSAGAGASCSHPTNVGARCTAVATAGMHHRVYDTPPRPAWVATAAYLTEGNPYSATRTSHTLAHSTDDLSTPCLFCPGLLHPGRRPRSSDHGLMVAMLMNPFSVLNLFL